MTLFDQKRRQNEEIMKAYQQKQMMEQFRNRQAAMGINPTANIPNVGAVGNTVHQTLNNIPQTPVANAIANPSTGSTISKAINASAKGANAGSALSKVGALGKYAGPALGAAGVGMDLANGNYGDAAWDAAILGANFIPGAGQAISLGLAGAKMAKDMVEGNKKKAMAASMNALKQNEANTINNLNETKANIAQQQQENQSAIQNALANQNMQSPMATMPFNDALGQTDTNTPTLLQTPVLEYPTAAPADNTGLVSDIMSGVKNMGNTVKSNVPTMVNNALEKTKTGLGDFAEGFIDNRNTSFMEGDVYNQIGNESQPPITIDENGVLQGGVEETKKSIMNRLGEAAGTTARTLSNPAVQGLIAGLLYKATGGDTGESLNYGVNWGMNKAKSDNYARQMGKQPNIWGTYTEGDYKNYMDNQNKLADRELSERKFAHDKEKTRYAQTLEAKKLAEQERHNKISESQNHWVLKHQKEEEQQQTNAEINKNLEKYVDILLSGDKLLIEKAKTGLIGAYGGDILKTLDDIENSFFEKKGK